jgi:hypothetical protein
MALAGQVVACMALAAAVVAFWPQSPSRITLANASRIVDGMSFTEVVNILGPQGDYSTGPIRATAPPTMLLSRYGGRIDFGKVPHSNWFSDEAYIGVLIGDSDGVYGVEFAPVSKKKQSLVDNLLWLAKRQWHRWFP